MSEEKQQGAGRGAQGAGNEEEIQKIIAERDQYLEGWKRAQADYKNIVKETDQKRAEFADWATERVLTQLIPALDQYEVALRFTPSLDAIPEDQRRPFENWIVGLEAVRSLWWKEMQELGLEQVLASGAFDSSLHEAVGEASHETIPEGQIIRAMMNGYLLKGKLIRPAKVILSKGK